MRINSSNTDNLDIEPEHLKLVKDIISIKLPQHGKVYIFGSRVANTAKKYSDLDLAFDFGRKMTLHEIAELKELFENSDLPYMVDIVDVSAIDLQFKNYILTNGLSLNITKTHK